MKNLHVSLNQISSISFLQQSKEAYETLLQTVQALEEQLTNKIRDYESQLRVRSICEFDC